MEKGQKGLYFIAGVAPTDDERAEAAALGITAFRSAELAGAVRAERCDVAAGAVPAAYLKREGVRVVRPTPAPAPETKVAPQAPAQPAQQKRR